MFNKGVNFLKIVMSLLMIREQHCATIMSFSVIQLEGIKIFGKTYKLYKQSWEFINMNGRGKDVSEI